MPRAPMSAEVRRDAVGVPHLRAGDVMELARLQGRVTALDRAWQVEHHRWRMEGRTAEHVGAHGLRLGPLRPAGAARADGAALLRAARRRDADVADGLRRRRQRDPRRGARGHARGRAARAPVVCRRAAPVGAVDAARHLLGHPPALRDLPGQALQRARRRPARRRGPRRSSTPRASSGPRPRGATRGSSAERARRAGCPSSRVTRTARSSCPAATSRSAWPVPSSTSSASPSPGCPACSTSPTRAPSRGASRTPWPTTRT